MMTLEKAELIFSKKREPLPDYDNLEVLEFISSKFDQLDQDSARYYDSSSHVNLWVDWPKININSTF
jgi:hypothetical protein